MDFLSVIVRCKNEPFVLEFVNHYLNEGVDKIYLIDDDSSIAYDAEVLENPKVKFFWEKDIINRNIVDDIYKNIKDKTEWLIYVDIDEFITSKKNLKSTIREILKNDFSQVDCVKVPWVMMSANGREVNPKNLLEETIYRWNHDKKHINTKSKEHKFRCRYEAIEIKSIFKPSKFEKIWDHHPKEPIETIKCAESVYGKDSELSPFYNNLREKDIAVAHLVCYHFRIISIENSKSKIDSNIWYKSYSIDDLTSSDYAEVIDETLKIKSLLGDA